MIPKAKILVVDDEFAIRYLMRVALERSGYAVVEGTNARDALVSLRIDKPDIVLLDLGLPDRDGIELVPLIRANSEAHVIVVSARDHSSDKVAALDLGADDFVTKPFDTEELLARVRSSLRNKGSGEIEATLVAVGDVVIDLMQRRVTMADIEIRFTNKEFAFLAELAKRPGRLRTHVQLLNAVWGPAHEEDLSYLRVAARSIRGKFGPQGMSLVRNEPGLGYRLYGDFHQP